MMLVTLILLIESAPSCPGCRPSLTSNASFRDCSFIGCYAALDGGCVYLSNAACALGLFGCLFTDSASSRNGGAVYADPVLTFSLSSTSGRNCSALSNSFGRINIISPESGSINVIDASAAACVGGPDTLWIAGGRSASVRSSNATRNRATDSGSALFFTRIPKLALEFCMFAHNADANCIYFCVGVDGADAASVAVVANACGASRGRGVVGVASNGIAFASSVFRQNTFDCFIGTEPGGAGDVAFVRCIFDVAGLSATRGIRVMTVEDTHDSSETDEQDDETITPTPQQTDTQAHLESRTPTTPRTPETHTLMPAGSQSIGQTLSQSPLPTPGRSHIGTVSEGDIPSVSQSDIPPPSQSDIPSVSQSDIPTVNKSDIPTVSKSDILTVSQSDIPTVSQSDIPTVSKSDIPTVSQSTVPTVSQSDIPTASQSSVPTMSQSVIPVVSQSRAATLSQTASPTVSQVRFPSATRSCVASESPSVTGSRMPNPTETCSRSTSGHGQASKNPTESPSNASGGSRVWVGISIAASVVAAVMIVIGLVVVLKRRQRADAWKPMNETLDVEQVELLPRRAGKSKR